MLPRLQRRSRDFAIADRFQNLFHFQFHNPLRDKQAETSRTARHQHARCKSRQRPHGTLGAQLGGAGFGLTYTYRAGLLGLPEVRA